MIFADRTEAGIQLAEALSRFEGDDAVVLAIPRGGVVVAEPVARRLSAPLDVVVPRKVGAPGNPELGLGAVAPGVRVLDERLIRDLGVTPDYLEQEIAAQEDEIARRLKVFRRGRLPVDVTGRTVIVVDDGVATGGTAVAACRWARAHGAGRVVLAVPVAPRQAIPTLGEEVDELVVLATPDPFYAVGQWYRDFEQVSDEEVARILDQAARGPDPDPGRGE
ncbi:MAG: phosphoribosyltransferase [Actinomycetota bacterium]|nr:phosphoribosyltransferase [Actinomycetota bacterium]